MNESEAVERVTLIEEQLSCIAEMLANITPDAARINLTKQQVGVFLVEAREDAERTKKEIIAEAKVVAANEQARGLKELQAAVAKAQTEMQEKFAEIAKQMEAAGINAPKPAKKASNG